MNWIVRNRINRLFRSLGGSMTYPLVKSWGIGLILLFTNCGLLFIHPQPSNNKNALFGLLGLASNSQNRATSTSTNSTSTSLVLQYGSSSYSFTKNLALTVTPSLSSSASSCAASPDLPTGLGLNPSNCVISGTPTALQGGTNYTITATASTGTNSVTISIEVKDIPPGSLTYSITNLSYTVNTAVTTITPTYIGTITSCTASPSLPNGILLDNTNCSLSGTPLTAKPLTTYIITASNAYGSTTATLYITVNPIALSGFSYAGNPFSMTQSLTIAGLTPTITGTPTSCSSLPTLPAGLSISTSCVISGTPSVIQAATNYTITATNAAGSTTTVISVAVIVAPPSSLVYSGSPYTLSQNVGMTTITPTMVGTPTNCVSAPTLPTGLSINPLNCAITGTPTVLSGNTSYTITASNTSGNTSTTIGISVILDPPTSISYTGSPYTFYSGTGITTITPTIVGNPTSCVASPALPGGLTLSATTCAISGVPILTAASVVYTITASNVNGSASTTITIRSGTTAIDVYGQFGSFTTNVANNGGVSADSLNNPISVTTDLMGNLYALDIANNRGLFYPVGTTTATRVYGQFGSFTCGVINNNGSCVASSVSADNLYNPAGIRLDSSGNAYMTDEANHRVLFYPSGSTFPTVVYGQGGNYTLNVANNGGISASSLNYPYAILIDSSNNLYVSDSSNHRVLFYPSGSTTATRVYGQNGSFTTGSANNGGLTANSLNVPTSLALDASNNLYICDHTNSRILFYPSGSTTATRVYGQFGSFTCNVSNNNGSCSSGTLSANNLFSPHSIAIDSGDNLYVSDAHNNRLLYYPSSSTTATRVYGQNGSFSSSTINNGGISANSLNFPDGIALNGNIYLYVVDATNNRVLKYLQ